MTKSNILESFPDLKSMDVEHEDDDDLDSNQNSEVSWQAKLATYARHCLDCPEHDPFDRNEWIQSWYGGGPAAPRPSGEYSSNEIEN